MGVHYRTIARALQRGSPEAIADGYLDLARLLVRTGRIVTAIAELEEGIDVVGGGQPPGTVRPAPEVSRLLAGLSGLHGLLGDRPRAMRSALLAHRLAPRGNR